MWHACLPWLAALARRNHSAARSLRRPYPVVLERLEERLAPATFTVDSLLDLPDDTPGDGICAATPPGGGAPVCTLRAAIMEANALAGPDDIVLPAGTYTLTRAGAGEDAASTGDLDITGPLTIRGAGPGTTIIQAGATAGAGIDRVLDIHATATIVSLSGVTMRHGTVTGSGGGLRSASGNLVVAEVVVSDNSASVHGGGIYCRSAAGSPLQLTSSTLSGNEAGEEGGGFWNSTATVSITNCTFSNNTADEEGGGVYQGVGPTGSISLLHATVTLNRSPAGGGLFNDATGVVQLTNSLVAGNLLLAGGPGGPDVFGPYASGGNNLIGNGEMGTGFNQPGDQVGTPGNPIDARIGPLADNGGSTPTHALLAGSPALNAANSALAPPTDQRGVARPQGGAADIGAFEEVVPLAAVVCQPPRGVFVIPGTPGQLVRVEFRWIFRHASFNNEVGVFLVDEFGRAGGAAPRSGAFLRRALGSRDRRVVFRSGETAGIRRVLTFRAGDCISFYLAQNQTTERLLAANPFNNRDRLPLGFFSQTRANPDGRQHVRMRVLRPGLAILAWEDLTGTGDRDFNDVIMSVRVLGV